MEENSEKLKLNRSNIINIVHRNKVVQWLFFIVCMSILFVMFLVAKNSIAGVREKELLLEQETIINYDILCDIERIEDSDGVISLFGWAMAENLNDKKVRIMMFNNELSESVLLPVTTFEREDIEDIFANGHDDEVIGFTSELTSDRLKKNICYEIAVVIEKDRDSLAVGGTNKTSNIKIATGKYILNDELYRYNPKIFFEPDVTDDEVLQVIKYGILRAYDLNAKMWIYQKDDYLFFIFDPENWEISDEVWEVPVMPYTSKKDMLPDNRAVVGFDHLGSFTDDVLYEREGVLPYKVVKVSLLSTYTNTYFSTGIYDKLNNKWYKHFDISVLDWSVDKYHRETRTQ